MSEEQLNDAEEPSSKRLTVLERVATTISVLLVGALLAVLGWDAAHPNAPPEFKVESGVTTAAYGHLRTTVTVTNIGDDAAKSVVVHIALEGPDTVKAETELTIDWLPGHSSRNVVGVFPEAAHSADSARVRVVASVHGYAEP
jgi:uncharacterized protein (TIGR02588 family)